MGYGQYGQLAVGTTTDQYSPVIIPSPNQRAAVQLSMGQYHSAGIVGMGCEPLGFWGAAPPESRAADAIPPDQSRHFVSVRHPQSVRANLSSFIGIFATHSALGSFM